MKSKENTMTTRQIAAAETRKKLIEVAREIIREKGLVGTQVEEITAAAGVSKGTFYTYFKHKEDILAEIRYGEFGEILEAAKDMPGTFTEKLRFFMVNFSAHIEESGAKMAQEWVRNVVNPALVHGTPNEGKLPYDLSCMRALFMRGIEAKLLRENTPVDYLSHTLIDLLYGQMLCWAMSDGVYSLKSRTEEFISAALDDMLRPYIL